MSASNPSSGRIAAENELLARLGLPPSATAEDVDQLHLAVSQFLAAAPTGIKGWARAQASALDEAYLTLTDPVGLEGSALRSPTRPPTVVPGGPATPPARRDPVPAVEAVTDAAPDVAPDPVIVAAQAPAPLPATDDTDTDDLDALYASVTPGAHRDLTSGGAKRSASPSAVTAPGWPQPAAAPGVTTPVAPSARRHTRAVPRPAPAVTPAPASSGAGPWKAVAILASAVLVVVVAALVVVPFVFNLGSGSNVAAAQASATAPAVDQAKVSALMAKIQADPKDTVSLQALGDEFYQGQQYTQAATFYDQLLALDPNNIKALLARGATYFNLGDLANAERIWKSVIALKPSEKSQLQEAHYDLGFLYMNEDTPDWTKVASEWQTVIDIDGTSQLAQLVQQHITSLVKASMIPASLAPAASSSPAASGGAANPASPAVAPSGSAPASSPAAASPASSTVNEGAQGLAFTSNSLAAPANTPFTIHYNNQDSGIPHDMLIKDSSGKTVFQGDMVTGPNAVDYQVPALASGTYTFICSIHPTTMNGTLVVGN